MLYIFISRFFFIQGLNLKRYFSDGTPRPAELSHHLRQFYWWTPAKGPEAQRALLQQPGTL